MIRIPEHPADRINLPRFLWDKLILCNTLPVGRFVNMAESPLVTGFIVKLRMMSPSFNLEELKYL